MENPQLIAALRIRELENLLREKDQECVTARRERHRELQVAQFRHRLEASVARRSERSVHMDDWSCDDLAGWFQEIQLSDYCHFIFTQE